MFVYLYCKLFIGIIESIKLYKVLKYKRDLIVLLLHILVQCRND
jgi:hypothetical protein